ncbi:hypothetical protein [Portibacter lacus]|uniref:Uncharacterized protein n=1 Tax=Portibacter lacus TaxID=1099794 RepID=A0AA37SSX7_9BACT|nr:hypothetical protein [Portibacter lacus]GLR19537.1 hypothetical protein GCM10007940_41530 [Portibacter lacus]
MTVVRLLIGEVTIVILFNSMLCAQSEQFEIEYLHESHTSSISIDEDAYVWFPNEENNDFYRYSGHAHAS